MSLASRRSRWANPRQRSRCASLGHRLARAIIQSIWPQSIFNRVAEIWQHQIRPNRPIPNSA